MSAYLLLKFAHVFLAIVAVGFNVSYAIWLTRASRNQEHLSFVLRGIKFLDDRFANPAYILLPVTGFAMVIVGGIPLRTPWLSAAMGLYVVLALLGFGSYSPTLRRQIEAAEKFGPESAEYRQLASRGNVLGGTMAIIVAVVIFLMVTKPGP